MKCKDCDINEAIGVVEVVYTEPETGIKEVTGSREYSQCDSCRKEMYRQIIIKRELAKQQGHLEEDKPK